MPQSLRQFATKISISSPWQLAIFGCSLLLVTFLIVVIPPGRLPGRELGDTALQHWPAADFFRESIYEYGVWPWWNPSRMLGQPFAANPLNKVWYPLQWIVLILPSTLHLNLMIYLHIVILVVGMFLWARAAAYSLLAAAWMTLSLALNTKLLAHLGAGHLDVFYAVAWVPMLLWAIVRTLQQPTVRRFLLLALVAALLTLADLRIAAMMLAMGFGVALVNVISLDRVPVIVRGWLLAGGVYLLLVAVQLVPLAQLSSYMTRSSLTPQQAAAFSLDINLIVTGLLLGPTLRNHELTVYVGLPVLILAGFALTRGTQIQRREVLLWVGLIIFGVLWALGQNGPIFLPIVSTVPGLTLFRVPSRVWFVVAFALIALSGRGLDRLVAKEAGKGSSLFAVALVAAGACWLVGILLLLDEMNILLIVFGISLLGFGVIVLLLKHRQTGWQTQVLLPLYHTGIMIVVASTVLESQTVIDWTMPQAEAVREFSTISECGRLLTTDYDISGAALSVNDTWSLNGVDPFQLRVSVAVIQATVGYERQRYAIPVPSLRTADQTLALNVDQLEALNVVGVVSPSMVANRDLTHVGSYSGLELYQTAAVVAADCTQHPNQRRASDYLWRSSGGQSTLALPWVPGWRATADGVPLQFAASTDGFIQLDASEPVLGEVLLMYRPTAQMIAAVVSAVTAIVIVTVVLSGKPNA